MPDLPTSDRVRAAACAWGTPQGPPRPVSAGPVPVFDVTLADGRRIALRLHADDADRQAIDTALKLAETLADAGFATPWPQRTLAGGLTDTTTGTCASALHWIAARPLDLVPVGPARAGMMQALGTLLADLHLTADAVAPAARDHSDSDPVAAALSCAARLDRMPDIPDADRACLDRAAKATRAGLAALEGHPTGLIHGDPTPGHILCAPDGLYLIALHRAGPGWRAQDLAAALWPHVDAPDLPRLRDALQAGYIAGGGATADAAPDRIALFLTLRAMAAAGGTSRRDPHRATAIARALAAAHTLQA